VSQLADNLVTDAKIAAHTTTKITTSQTDSHVPQFVRLGSNFSITTTDTAVTGQSFSVSANTNYYFIFSLPTSSANAPSYAITVPSGATLSAVAAIGTSGRLENMTVSGTFTTAVTGGTTLISGTVAVGATAGTVALRAIMNTGTGTLLAGAYLQYQQIST
jgi:hypothetical protein